MPKRFSQQKRKTNINKPSKSLQKMPKAKKQIKYRPLEDEEHEDNDETLDADIDHILEAPDEDEEH